MLPFPMFRSRNHLSSSNLAPAFFSRPELRASVLCSLHPSLCSAPVSVLGLSLSPLHHPAYHQGRRRATIPFRIRTYEKNGAEAWSSTILRTTIKVVCPRRPADLWDSQSWLSSSSFPRSRVAGHGFSCSHAWTTISTEFPRREYARRSSGSFLGQREVGLADPHREWRRSDPPSLQSVKRRRRENASRESRRNREGRRLRSQCRRRKHSTVAARSAPRTVAQALLPVRFYNHRDTARNQEWLCHQQPEPRAECGRLDIRF